MSLKSGQNYQWKNFQKIVFSILYLFSLETYNIRLTPLNLYWQVEIINNIPVSICSSRCVYNDPKLVIWSPGYRSRLALIYRIIIQQPLCSLSTGGARRDIYAEQNRYIYNNVKNGNVKYFHTELFFYSSHFYRNNNNH